MDEDQNLDAPEEDIVGSDEVEVPEDDESPDDAESDETADDSDDDSEDGKDKSEEPKSRASNRIRSLNSEKKQNEKQEKKLNAKFQNYVVKWRRYNAKSKIIRQFETLLLKLNFLRIWTRLNGWRIKQKAR